MNASSIATFSLVVLGVVLVALGAWMSLEDFKKKHAGELKTHPDGLAETLTALTKLVVALRDYPVGQQLIVWGIVVLIIAGLFGGVAGLAGS